MDISLVNVSCQSFPNKKFMTLLQIVLMILVNQDPWLMANCCMHFTKSCMVLNLRNVVVVNFFVQWSSQVSLCFHPMLLCVNANVLATYIFHCIVPCIGFTQSHLST